MKVTIARTLEEVAPFAAQWASAPMRNVFSTYEVARVWLEQASGDLRPFILAVHDGPTLVAVAPWCLRRGPGGVRMLTGIGGDDAWFHDLLMVSAGDEEAVADAIATALAGARKDWGYLRLHLRPSESAPLLRALDALGFRYDERVGWRQHPAMDLRDGWASYWDGRDSSFKHTLGRYAKRLQKVPHRYVWAEGDEAQALLATLFALQATNKHDMRDWEAFQAFMRMVCRAADQRGQLVVAALLIEDRPAAIDVAIRCGDQAFGLLRSFDPAMSRYCAGLQITRWLLERLAAEGVHYVDGGPGDYEWKRRFRNATTATVRAHLARPMCLAGLWEVAWHRYVRAWLKEHRDLVDRVRHWRKPAEPDAVRPSTHDEEAA